MKRKRDLAYLITIGITTAAAASAMTASDTIAYTYDARGRLIKVEHSGTINNGVVANYTLDKSDNRVNVKVTGVP